MRREDDPASAQPPFGDRAGYPSSESQKMPTQLRHFLEQKTALGPPPYARLFLQGVWRLRLLFLVYGSNSATLVFFCDVHNLEYPPICGVGGTPHRSKSQLLVFVATSTSIPSMPNRRGNQGMSIRPASQPIQRANRRTSMPV